MNPHAPQTPLGYMQFRDVKATATSSPIGAIPRMNGLEEKWTLVVHAYVVRTVSPGRPLGTGRKKIAPDGTIIMPRPEPAQAGPWGEAGNLFTVFFVKEKGVWKIEGYTGLVDSISEVAIAKACSEMPGGDPTSTAPAKD